MLVKINFVASAILIGTILIGCAPRGIPENVSMVDTLRPNGHLRPQAELDADVAACNLTARAMQNAYDRPLPVAGAGRFNGVFSNMNAAFTSASHRERDFTDCMAARGWKEETPLAEAPAEIRPTARWDE